MAEDNAFRAGATEGLKDRWDRGKGAECTFHSERFPPGGMIINPV